MSISTISKNLCKLLRAHNELSLSELARQTTIPQPTLHHLLNGTTKRPRRKVLESLSSYFNISIAELTGQIPLYEPIPNDVKKELKIMTIPIISWDMLKDWPNNDHEAGQFGEIVLTKDIGKHSFALIMKEATIDPYFPIDSVLIFDGEKEVQDRDLALVYSPNHNKIMLNRLFIEKSDYFIKKEQSNGNMMLIKLNLDSDRILGSLIEARLVQF